MHNDGFVPYIAFLELRGAWDGVIEGRFSIGVGNQTTFGEETEIPNAEGVGAVFVFGDICTEVLARAYSEEDIPNAQLGCCNILDGISVSGEFSEDSNCEIFCYWTVVS